jgi:hypothetical protein
MNAFDDFLVSQEFQKRIGAFCARQGWAVARLGGGGARIDFEMPNGWRRSVYILRHERVRLVDNEFFRSLVRYLAKTCDDLDQVIQARACSQNASILPPEV